jgi:hypothetical protein
MGEFLEGSVDVPAIGKTKKVYVLVPAGLAAAYVGWRWYQARSGANAAPAPGADGTYTTPDLTDMGLSTTGGLGNVTGNTGSTVTDGTRPGSIDDNAAWTAAATERLGDAGWDRQAVQAALGEFLARRALDKSEAAIVRAALAVAGQPPVGGPYPVIEEAATGTGTLPAPAHLRAYNQVTTTQIPMQWDPVPGASHYEIYSTSSAYGFENLGSSVDTFFYARNLTPNTSYGFYVVAVGTTGKKSPKSNTYTAKTAPVRLTAPTGLRASAVTRTSFRVTVNPVPGATYYRWYINGSQIGNSDHAYRDFVGLKANTAYQIKVAADTTNQAQGPTSAPLTVRTKK